MTDQSAFFYCDPPYYNTEDYYDGGGFGKDDHERLANTLCNIQGKFLLSYNDCPEIRELYQDREFLLKVLPELTISLNDMRAANNIQNFSYLITIHRNE